MSRTSTQTAGRGGDEPAREVVMFDFDGVIVDSLEIFGTAFLDAWRAGGLEGFDRVEDFLGLMEDNFYEGMRRRGISAASVAAVMERVGAALVRARRWLKPFPLMPEVLEELSLSRTVVIVTSSPNYVVEGWLRGHDVGGIAEVAGADKGESKTAKIRGLQQRYPGQTLYWYVADTAGDIREARAAGATPLGVAWGWHEPALLVEAGAEHIAHAPADVLRIVAPELASDFFVG